MSQAMLALKNEATPSRSTRASRGAASGLRMNAPGDAFEREADRVAEQIMAAGSCLPRWSLSRVDMRAPLQRKCACGGSAHEEGECEACKEKRMLQRKATAAGPGRHAPAIVDDVLNMPGQPLDPATREFFEHRFGQDFSGIRVHFDAQAAESARSVNALAYTVGNRIAFAAGHYSPHTTEGRRLIAHELAHTVQQSHADRPHSGAFPNDLSSQINGRPYGFDGSLTGQQTPGIARPRLSRVAQPSLQRQPNPISANEDFSAIIARLEQIIRTGGAVPTETRVIAAAIIDIPGYKGPLEMRAISGAATDVLGQGAAVPHAASPAAGTRTLSATRTIAGAGARHEFPFSHVNDAEIKLFEAIKGNLPNDAKGSIHFLTMRVRQVHGQTVFEPIPACSGCTRATFEMGTFRGVNMISHAATHPTGTLNLADEPAAAESTPAKGAQSEVTPGETGETGPASQGGKAAGEAPGTSSVKVQTNIDVKNVVKNPDGSTVSEIEYNFGENLKRLNQGAPPGSEIPARITMRITTNAEGAITSVESLSGEPSALVEALARQTLSEGLTGEAGGAAGAGRLAGVTKGVKIAGWAAFVVITGYQLYKATPAQRPRVLAKAAGGVVGGAAAGFGVCNLMLDFETAGWGVLICGLIAGGAGGFAGSEAGGAIYDEATATEMNFWLKELDQRGENERVLFNIVVGSLGTAADCIKPEFVMNFLSIVPTSMKDYEAVLVAGQVANSAVPGARPAAESKGAVPPSDRAHASHGMPVYPKSKSTTCPGGCHGESQASKQPTLKPLDPKEIDAELEAMKNAVPCDAVLGAKLDALSAAIRKLPEAPPPFPPVGRSGFPTAQQQKGKDVCPNCHREVQNQFDRSLRDSQLNAPKYEPLQPAPDWVNPKQGAPAAPAQSGTHATPQGVHFSTTPQGFPSVEEQQGQSCPTCHKSTQDMSGQGWLGGAPGMGSGGSGQITPEQRKALEDWIAAESK